MRSFNFKLSEEEVELMLSTILFAGSVNVIVDTKNSKQYLPKLIELAKKVKTKVPDIKLKYIQFIKEESYEDQWSEDLYNTFKDNVEIVTFDKA